MRRIKTLKLSNFQTLPRVMLVDMNSFFASVEQQANPHLRGQPVGVCASVHRTSCIIAASKEAKKLGIKTGTLVYKAQKICPKIILLEAEPEKYREVNHRINKIFFDYTSAVEGYSIDESFLNFKDSKLNPLVVGAEIKQRIREEVGEWLTCSIGIGENKFLAKLAADMQKPDGLTVIWRDQLRQIYTQKKLSDLWGIGRGWTKRLEKLGITNPAQILDYSVENLMALFGKSGFDLWLRVSGLEESEVSVEEDAPKSFGHSWVLNFRTTRKDKLESVVMRLAEKAARRMRKEGFIAAEIYLSVLLVDGSYFGKSKKLKFYIETGSELYTEAMKIWQAWDFNKEVMHIAVGFRTLSSKVNQLSLFQDKNSLLVPTLDRINDKYGEFTIRPALLGQSNGFAPDAIAFGR
jgi:DNA polymerase-4